MTLDNLLESLAHAEIAEEDVPRVMTAVSALLAAVAARKMRLPSASSCPDPRLGEERLLTADEVAALFGVPRSYIYELARRAGPDALPSVAFGKYVRFRAADVLTWRARHQRRPLESQLSSTAKSSYGERRDAAAPATRESAKGEARRGRSRPSGTPSGVAPKQATLSERDGRSHLDETTHHTGTRHED